MLSLCFTFDISRLLNNKYLNKKNKDLRCNTIGAGYVGEPTLTVIADKSPQYKVTIVIDVFSNPEFLTEGTTIIDLNNHDSVLIASRETEEEFILLSKLWIFANRFARTHQNDEKGFILKFTIAKIAIQ